MWLYRLWNEIITFYCWLLHEHFFCVNSIPSALIQYAWGIHLTFVVQLFTAAPEDFMRAIVMEKFWEQHCSNIILYCYFFNWLKSSDTKLYRLFAAWKSCVIVPKGPLQTFVSAIIVVKDNCTELICEFVLNLQWLVLRRITFGKITNPS